MNMEKETWIENILNSTNGMAQAAPDDRLFLKIRQKIKQQNTVSPQTVWLVAASIAILAVLNFTVVKTAKSQQNNETSTPSSYLEPTVNQSNQLYQ